MITDYYDSLDDAGVSLHNRHETFIDKFAPKAEDSNAILGIFLTLLPVPFNTGVARFFGGG